VRLLIHLRGLACRGTHWRPGATAYGVRPERGRQTATMTAAVGAAHRLPCAARPGVARRNSLRSLRELRSDNRRENDGRSALRAPTPRLRCSAPPKSPPSAAPAPAERHTPSRRAASARRSANREAARNPDGTGIGAFLAATGGISAHAATVLAKARASTRAGGGRRACARPRSAAVPARARSALRTSDSPRLSERSSRSERSEFRGGAGIASIAGNPRAAGASTGTPATAGTRAGSGLCPHWSR